MFFLCCLVDLLHNHIQVMDKSAASILRSCRAARSLHTTASNAAPGPSRKPRPQDDFSQSLNVKDVGVYQFDDPTSLGWMRLEKVREAQELYRKLEMDREILQGRSLALKDAITSNQPLSAQAKMFNPPTTAQSVRIRSSIDLSYPSSLAHRKSVLVAPVGSLPLKGAEAVQRFKLIAGPRWTPGYPGRAEQTTVQGSEDKEGWIKIAEERFPDARTNRWNVGQMLEKLVEAANVGQTSRNFCRGLC